MIRVMRMTYPGSERVIGYGVYSDGQSNILYTWVFPQIFREELGAVLYGLLLKDKAPRWADQDTIAYADSVREFMLSRFGEAPEELDEYWKILAEDPEDIYGEFAEFRFRKLSQVAQ